MQSFKTVQMIDSVLSNNLSPHTHLYRTVEEAVVLAGPVQQPLGVPHRPVMSGGKVDAVHQLVRLRPIAAAAAAARGRCHRGVCHPGSWRLAARRVAAARFL